MATTPNYGWVTPAPTDFVTDLPADFETFADAVDADLAGLLGGTTNQVLTKDSNSDHDFSWQDPASGGKVLQVVSATTTTQTQVASTTLADTTLTATITPTLASSKILVLITQHYRLSRNGTNVGVKFKVFRDATTILDYSTTSTNFSELDLSGSITAVMWKGLAGITYLDSPATTSAITYKTQGAASTTSDSGQVYFQFSSAPSTITLIEIGA